MQATTTAPDRVRPRRWTRTDMLAAACVTVAAGIPPIGYITYKLPTAVDTVTWPASIPGLILLGTVTSLVLGLGVMNGRPGLPSRAAIAYGGAVLLLLLITWVRYEPDMSRGSDRADALEVGVRLLLQGDNPYLGLTSLGNTLSPMMGGILLAVPLVLLFGSLTVQGPLWLVGIVAALGRASGWSAALAGFVMLAVNPAIRLELVTLSDGWINAAAIVLAGSAGFAAAARAGITRWGWHLLVAASVLSGLTLAYRFIFAFAFIPMVIVIGRNRGPAVARVWAAVTGGTAVLVAVVPWLADPHHYAPFTKAGHASSPLIPGWGVLCALVTLAVLLRMCRTVRTPTDAWAATAVSLAVLLFLVGIGQGSLNSYQTAAFCGSLLVFAVAALTLPRIGVVAPPPTDRNGSGGHAPPLVP